MAKDNVVLLGPSGTGKTYLAIAFWIRACLAGRRVAFATRPSGLPARCRARVSAADEELRKLLLTPLLIVNEVGYIPSTRRRHDTRRRACLSRDTYYEPYRDADVVPGWSMRESGARRDSHLAR